jgi:Tfp pilus assembly protein PilO
MELFKDRVITKADWIIIGVSLFLLVLMTAGYVVVSSLINDQIDAVQAQVNKTQTKVDEARAIAAKKDGLLKELEFVRHKISSFEEKLPTEKEIPRLLRQFQQIAELSGVKYQLITAEPIEEQEMYVRVPFKVKVKGAYPQIGEFLRSLEFGNRFIKVEGMDIGPQEKGNSEADFIISTFMFVNRESGTQSEVTQS